MNTSTLQAYDPALPAAKALEYLGFGHIESLRKLVRLGKISAIREPGVKSALRFRLSELNRYLASREQKREARHEACIAS